MMMMKRIFLFLLSVSSLALGQFPGPRYSTMWLDTMYARADSIRLMSPLAVRREAAFATNVYVYGTIGSLEYNTDPYASWGIVGFNTMSWRARFDSLYSFYGDDSIKVFDWLSLRQDTRFENGKQFYSDTDTLATKAYARSLAGGGSGSTDTAAVVTKGTTQVVSGTKYFTAPQYFRKAVHAGIDSFYLSDTYSYSYASVLWSPGDLSGTITATNGSPIITGSGTNFLTRFSGVSTIYIQDISDGTVAYGISSVDNNAQITLSDNYVETGGSGFEYGKDTTLTTSVAGALFKYQKGTIISSGDSSLMPARNKDLNTFMYFPARGALRAGKATGTQWDSANLGTYSFAFGLNNNVSGAYSFASGSTNTVSSSSGFAFGSTNTISGSAYGAIGSTNTVSGAGSFALGSGNTVSNGPSYLFGSGLKSAFPYNFIFGTNQTLLKQTVGGFVYSNWADSIYFGHATVSIGVPYVMFNMQKPLSGGEYLGGFGMGADGIADTSWFVFNQYAGNTVAGTNTSSFAFEKNFGTSQSNYGKWDGNRKVRYIYIDTANGVFLNAQKTEVGQNYGDWTLSEKSFIISQGYLDADSLRLNGSTVATSGTYHSGLGPISLGAITTKSPLAVRGATSSSAYLVGDSASNKDFAYYSYNRGGDSLRWVLRVATAESETSPDLGGNFSLRGYDDAGTYLGDVLNFTRSTGAAIIGSYGAGTLSLKTNGTTRWYLGSTTGHLIPNADNTYDIGASGTEIRNIYADGQVNAATAKLSSAATIALKPNMHLGSDGIVRLATDSIPTGGSAMTKGDILDTLNNTGVTGDIVNGVDRYLIFQEEFLGKERAISNVNTGSAMAAGTMVGSQAWLGNGFRTGTTLPAARSGQFGNEETPTGLDTSAFGTFYIDVDSTRSGVKGQAWFIGAANATSSTNVPYADGMVYKTRLKFGSATDTMGMFCGIGEMVYFATASVNTTDRIGFEYGQSAVGSLDSLYGVVCDGTTQQRFGVAKLAASTWYRLEWRRVGTTVYFYVDDVLKLTLATNVPARTTGGLIMLQAWSFDYNTPLANNKRVTWDYVEISRILPWKR